MKKLLILLFGVLQLAVFSQSTNLNGWMKNGNYLNNNTNFIGSADNRSLLFKTNNLQRFKIDSNGVFSVGGYSVNMINTGSLYNVKLNGLKGDGVTDDRNALNTLLNTTAPSGSTIYFPPGSYNIGSNIAVLDKRFTFTGDGSSSIIKTSANTQILNILSTASLASKWQFINLNFQGSGTGGNQAALYFSDNSGSFLISNCWFSLFGYAGVAVQNTETFDLIGGAITNCKFFLNNIGVDGANRSEYLQISTSDFVSNTTGIVIGGGNCTVNACNITYNVNGIKLITGLNVGHGIISSNNINHNSVYGIEVDGVLLGMSIADNHIYENKLKFKDCKGFNISGGIIDVANYEYDNNLGCSFNNVTFDTAYVNSTTLTNGVLPIYNNCKKLNGSVAISPNTFVQSNRGMSSNGALSLSNIKTTIAGSGSGSMFSSQPFAGTSYKKIILYCTALFGTATYTFPVAFINTPQIIITNGPGSSVVTGLSNTSVTITGATTTGFIILEGY